MRRTWAAIAIVLVMLIVGCDTGKVAKDTDLCKSDVILYEAEFDGNEARISCPGPPVVGSVYYTCEQINIVEVVTEQVNNLPGMN